MTNQQHPITPPPELVRQWRKSGPADAAANNAYERHIATQAARWGADQELEACCAWTAIVGGAEALRNHRRPKPPSLKEQALECLKNIDDACESEGFSLSDYTDIIRHALEALLLD